MSTIVHASETLIRSYDKSLKADIDAAAESAKNAASAAATAQAGATTAAQAVQSESVARTNADTTLSNRIDGKQNELVSGTNIKTLNGKSILGSGNLEVGGGDVAHDDFANVDIVPDHFTIVDLKTTMNKVLTILKGIVTVVSVAALLPAFADITAQKARLDSLYNDSLVVTDVSGAAIDTGAVSNIVEGYGYATTNYVDAHAGTPGDYYNVSNRAYMAPVAYTWSSPDEWMLTFTKSSLTTTTEDMLDEFTEDMLVYSNAVETTTLHRSAQGVAVTVDETSLETPNIVSWAASDGASVTDTGLVTADADGAYRISATSDKGVVRGAYALLMGDVRTYNTNIYHVADASTYLKSVNDRAYEQIAASTKVADRTRSGSTYSVFNAQKVYITQPGVGNVKAFAVSPHILGTAAHYSNPWNHVLGTQTFTDANGNSGTVTKKYWINLRDWAVTNGWSLAEVKNAGAYDIAFIVCDTSGSVPDGCVPYFISPETAATKYGDGRGMAMWCASQFEEYALPYTQEAWSEVYAYDASILTSGDYKSTNTRRFNTRKDIMDLMASKATTYNHIEVGDSGKPTFFIDEEGRTVVTETWTFPPGGPNYVKAFYIIKAFVEAHGDTIKEAK